MKRFDRNILLFTREAFMSEQAIEKEVISLKYLLSVADTPEQFCMVTELVNRNRITTNPRKIVKEANHFRLRPFRFLINKN
ncbi:MAG: hypothetical protein J0M10_04610 [Chitinophagales bacterium]|nr:hypothetical protein [Chitinophagales bacterium]